MALTAAEKIKVRRYLGYPTVVPSNDFLGRTMNDLSAEAATEISAILVQIAAIDSAAISAASASGRAGIKRVEDVEFFGAGSSFAAQDAMRAKLVNDIANMLGVPLFSSSGGGALGFAN